METKELKSKSKLLKPVIRIGKNGMSEETIKEIKKHLKKRKLIKIKILKSFRSDNKKEIANNAAKLTGSKVIDSVGFVFSLYKER